MLRLLLEDVHFDNFLIGQFREFAVSVELKEAFFVCNVIQEDHAVSVVDFMLKNARQKTLGFDADIPAACIERTNADFWIARHDAVDVLYAEAAFMVEFGRTFVFDDFRVDERNEASIFFVVEVAPHDNDPLETVDLDGGQRDAKFVGARCFPIKGGSFHVGDERFDVVGNNFDLARALAQVIVGKGDDVVFSGHVKKVYSIWNGEYSVVCSTEQTVRIKLGLPVLGNDRSYVLERLARAAFDSDLPAVEAAQPFVESGRRANNRDVFAGGT